MVPVSTTQAVAGDRRRRRRGLALLALVAGVLLTTGGGAATLAVFVDSDSVSGSWTTGVVSLNAEPAVPFAATDVLPGYTETQALTVSNDGTTAMRYALSTTATNELGDTLELTVREQGTSCAAFDGTVVTGAGALDGAGFGSVAQGQQAGDRVLAAGTSEVLCLRVSLPLTAASTILGQSSSATFTFDAEQTANNP